MQSEQPPTAHCVLTPPHMQVVGIPHCPFWSPGELQPWAATNTEPGAGSMSMATTLQRVIPGDGVTDSFVRCGCKKKARLMTAEHTVQARFGRQSTIYMVRAQSQPRRFRFRTEACDLPLRVS